MMLSYSKNITISLKPGIEPLILRTLPRLFHSTKGRSSLAKDEIPLVNQYTFRTHNCGQLSEKDVGTRVNLCGWVQYTRFNNKIIHLKDKYGATQCIANKDIWTTSLKKLNLPNESVLQISGVVRDRPEDQKNTSISTGQVEVIADQVKILSTAKKDLPILSRDSLASPTAINQMKHRYLYLRSSEMQYTLQFRSDIEQNIRKFLTNLKFVDISTPTLFSRTPGGANEFIVPTQIPEKFYSLVQSPQQLKQLSMIGACDRYFQICRCYRDEPGRSDRQPEFTQVDIELSFTTKDHIMKLIEELMFSLLSELYKDSHHAKNFTASFNENKDLKRFTFAEAFNKYGTDKPDTRFEWPIKENSEGHLYIEIPHHVEDVDLEKIIHDAKAIIRVDRKTPEIESTDTSSGHKLLSVDRSEDARKVLGAARVFAAKKLEENGVKVYKSKLSFLWVIDFPLFSFDEEGKLQSNHHPFTAPTEDSLGNLKENPLQVLGQHYDLVLNGQEVAGGSIRIHDAELQKQIFTEILQVEEGTFDYFLEALRSGCPPHGGIAIGLERLVAILLNKESIKDVIAFPKTSSGCDLMTDSPHELGTDVKQLYHIK